MNRKRFPLAGKPLIAVAIVLAIVVCIGLWVRHLSHNVPGATPRSEKSGSSSFLTGNEKPTPQTPLGNPLEELGDLEELLEELIHLPLTETGGLPGVDSPLTAGQKLNDALGRSLLEEMLDKRRNVYAQMEPYYTVRQRIKDELRKTYGQITEDNIASCLDDVRGFRSLFWSAGDFDNVDSFDAIYGARALLEICLEDQPDNEHALRAMVEVLQSGWPRMPTGVEKEGFFERWPVKAELQNYLWRLWDKHISKKQDVSEMDLCYTADLIGWPTWSSRSPEELISMLNEDKSHSDEFKSHFKALVGSAPLDDEKRGLIAKWAIGACVRKGWQDHERQFRLHLDSIEQSTFPPFDMYFFASVTGESKEQEHRFTSMRGQSFLGPDSRVKHLRTRLGQALPTP